MPLNDKAVVTAAVGYIFTAAPGTAAPTPAELAALNLSAFQTRLGEDDEVPAPVVDDADADAGNGGTGGGTTKATTKADPDPKTTLPVAWSNIGHTSRGDLPEFGYEGGDTEVRGTWQNESLREIQTEPIADYLNIFLHQFDVPTFELYYGKDASAVDGVFGVAGGTVKPIEKALLIIIVDGDTRIGFYAPKASIRRDDSITLGVDEFAALPVRATFLKDGTKNKYEWINKDLFKTV